MIDSFHSEDDVHQLWIVVMNMFDQFGLCVGWARDENRTGVCNRLGNGVEIIVIFCCVPATDRVCLVMNVLGWVIRVQNEPFDVYQAEMEHARLMVIDPDDGVEVMCTHGISPLSRDRRNLRIKFDRYHIHSIG